MWIDLTKNVCRLKLKAMETMKWREKGARPSFQQRWTQQNRERIRKCFKRKGKIEKKVKTKNPHYALLVVIIAIVIINTSHYIPSNHRLMNKFLIKSCAPIILQFCCRYLRSLGLHIVTSAIFLLLLLSPFIRLFWCAHLSSFHSMKLWRIYSATCSRRWLPDFLWVRAREYVCAYILSFHHVIKTLLSRNALVKNGLKQRVEMNASSLLVLNLQLMSFWWKINKCVAHWIKTEQNRCHF